MTDYADSTNSLCAVNYRPRLYKKSSKERREKNEKAKSFHEQPSPMPKAEGEKVARTHSAVNHR